MCGRAKFVSTEQLAHLIDYSANISNISEKATPGKNIPIILGYNSMRVLHAAKWGFTDDGSFYNARIETVDTKPFWSRAFFNTRCLIPIKAFYEGKRWFTDSDVDDFIYLAAGLYKIARMRGAERVYTTMITTDATPEVEQFHPRMPLHIHPEDIDRWLFDIPNKDYFIQKDAPDLDIYRREPIS